MENVPIEEPIVKAIKFVQWWSDLGSTGKSFVLLLSIVIASAAINIYQYGEISQTQDEKSALEKENLSYAKDCENRVSAVTIKERNRSDSLMLTKEIEYEKNIQKLFGMRTTEIETRNEKTKKVLK